MRVFRSFSVFITDIEDASLDLGGMPGQKRWGVNRLEEFLGPLVQKGLRSVILFGVPEKKAKVRGKVFKALISKSFFIRMTKEHWRMIRKVLSYRLL